METIATDPFGYERTAIFSIRLHRARKAAGLSLRDLGERVGVSHAAIKKYEDGVAMPSSDILIGLSRTLKVRSGYFFRPDPIALAGIEYRKRSSLPKKRLDAITHEVIDQIERRIELENLFPQSPVKAFATVEGLVASITAMDQLHDNVREGEAKHNTVTNQIANLGDLNWRCPGHFIKLSARPDGDSYTMSIPATGHTRTFRTQSK